MKARPIKAVRVNATKGGRFCAERVDACPKLLASIRNAKDSIFSESRSAAAVPERMLQLALNEAEALAWQTGYPHLVFPALAMEKAQEVARWNQRQRSVRRAETSFALAA